MKRSSLLKTAIGLFTASCILLSYQTFPEVYNRYKRSKAKEAITQVTEGVSQTTDIVVHNVLKGEKTSAKYGKNIEYFDFSKMSEELIPKEKMKLPSDLEKGLNKGHDRPDIKNEQMFMEDFWKEAVKLDYTPDKFKEIDFKEAIQAAVEITASRFTYEPVDDSKNWFAQKYGKNLSTDEYFHYGLGDCDKYRNATIAVFEIIKSFNPKLENVHLSKEEFGGSMERHAWVSIIIPQKDYLILSHIDPTFYDKYGELEASKDESDSHILVYNDAFKAYFYHQLEDYEYASSLFEESLSKTTDKKIIEKLLDNMSFTVLMMDDKRIASEKIEWIRQQYELKGFKDNLDNMLYRSYKVHKNIGDKKKSESYLQRLFKECPESYWTKAIKKGED